MNKYTIKDLEKALLYLKDKIKCSYINLEIDDRGKLIFQTTDSQANEVKIFVFKTVDEESGTKMPEIMETRRLI